MTEDDFYDSDMMEFDGDVYEIVPDREDLVPMELGCDECEFLERPDSVCRSLPVDCVAKNCHFRIRV